MMANDKQVRGRCCVSTLASALSSLRQRRIQDLGLGGQVEQRSSKEQRRGRRPREYGSGVPGMGRRPLSINTLPI